jgi:hypothetical protein
MFKSSSKRAPRVNVVRLMHAIGCSVNAEVFDAELVRCNVLKPEGEVDLRHKCPVSRVLEDQANALVTQLSAGAHSLNFIDTPVFAGLVSMASAILAHNSGTSLRNAFSLVSSASIFVLMGLMSTGQLPVNAVSLSMSTL